MRQQYLITFILGVILSITLAIRLIYFQGVHGHSAFYFLSLFWICGVLMVIFILNIAWHLYRGHSMSKNAEPSLTWPNRRKTYRIIYPNYDRPTLFIHNADRQIKRQLECAILDLSQNGICFVDDGSLGPIRSFEGKILFQNGETLNVKGSILRNHKRQVSAKLNHDIDWAVILDEQRRLLSQTKPARK